MNFEITPLQDSEIEEYSRLTFTVFQKSDTSLSKCFWPAGYVDSVSTYLTPRTRKALNDPDAHLFMIKDASTKQVVGAAHWTIQREPKSIASILEDDERARDERESAAPVEGINRIAINHFRNIQAQCHREVMGGRPHVYLGVLVVSPQHQRRGVGSAAMKWGMDKADELGLPAYLESSQQGKGLYERWVFKVVEVLPFDAREYGHPDPAEHYIMVREPRQTEDA